MRVCERSNHDEQNEPTQCEVSMFLYTFHVGAVAPDINHTMMTTFEKHEAIVVIGWLHSMYEDYLK